MRVLFEAPTVAGLEVEITRKLAAGEDEAELARMIEEVQGLSEEELEAALAEDAV